MMNKYEALKLENQLCFALYATSREVIKLYKPFLDAFGLTYTQYITLLVLWEKEAISFKDLGQALHLDSGTLTPLIKKLEAMKLVIKYRDPQDDRVVIVELTEDGRVLKDEMVDIPNQLFCRVGGEVEEYASLKSSLESLLKKLS
jgi:transcriptional regulator, MarR family